MTHHGFSEEQIKKVFEDAGAGREFRLEEVAVVFNRGEKGDVKRRLFIARGVKGE